MLHPIFENILKPFSGAVNSNINSHSTESARNDDQMEDTPMNLNALMEGVEAHDAWLLAQQEAEDDAWNAACEEAEQAFNFNDLLDALADLPEENKTAAFACIADGRDTDVLHKTYEHLKRAKVEDILQKAKVGGNEWDDLGGEAA